jgi:phosphatidylglycerophosphatase A
MTSAKRKPVPARLVFGNPVCWLAFGFGSGLSAKAPGTFGTLAAIPLYLLAAQLPLAAYLAVTLAMFVAGIWICQRCERIIGAEDHSGIVWDEFVGLFITLAAIPPTAQNVVLGFLLFRLFDIWKPWPIRYFDRNIHGGLGIMLDDALAGGWAWLALNAVIRGFGS